MNMDLVATLLVVLVCLLFVGRRFLGRKSSCDGCCGCGGSTDSACGVAREDDKSRK